MRLLKVLPLLAAFAAPIAGCNNSEQANRQEARQKVRDKLSVNGYSTGERREGLQPIDYRIPGQQIPLINYDSDSSKGITLCDRNKDDLLDPKEVLDFVNIAIDDGDGVINAVELKKLFWASSSFWTPHYLRGDILPENPFRITKNLKATDDNFWKLYKTTEEAEWDGAKIGEGNITRAHINSVLAEIIKAENITAVKEEVDAEANRRIAVLGGSYRYLESNEDFRKAAEATVVRRKAVDFLLENKNSVWITKLQAK